MNDMNAIKTLPVIVKHERMNGEFQRLTPRTRAIVLSVSHVLECRFRYQAVWTEFHRTQDQQNLYYKDRIEQGFFVLVDGVKHYSTDKIRPTCSVHQFERGADLSRTVIKLKGDFGFYEMTDEEIRLITEETNAVFPYGKEPYQTCLFHEQYGRPHFHFQSLI